jgi:hypothetical protein
VLPELSLSRPYLKLDTQGYDVEVLKGGAAVMQKIVALQSECSVQPIYEGMLNFSDSIAFIESFGFQLSGIFPVVTIRHRLIEFDCVMVRAGFGDEGAVV